MAVSPAESHSLSRKSNRYDRRTNSRHRKMRMESSQPIKYAVKQATGQDWTHKSGSEIRPSQTQIQGSIIGGLRVENHVDDLAKTQKVPQVSNQELTKKLKAQGGGLRDAKSRDKYQHQHAAAGMESANYSRYSTLQQKNITAAEKNIFGPLADHLESQNPSLRGVLGCAPKVEAADPSQGLIREIANSSIMSNTSRRPYAAGENKRLRNEKKLASQNEQRHTNQADNVKQVSAQPAANVDHYRGSRASKKPQVLGQNQCMTEEASRVNSNERHKNSIQLGCASLNMTESNQDSMSKGIDSINHKNRHKLQKELLSKAELQNATAANAGSGPNDLPSSTPDLQGSIETTMIEQSQQLPQATQQIGVPAGQQAQALPIREYASTIISANDQRNASSPALRQSRAHDPSQAASDQQRSSNEKHTIKRGHGNPDAQERIGRSESNPDQSLSRAATLQQYINSKKQDPQLSVKSVIPGVTDSTETPFNYKGSINNLQHSQDSNNQTSRRWMGNNKPANNNVKIMYYDPHGNLVEQRVNMFQDLEQGRVAEHPGQHREKISQAQLKEPAPHGEPKESPYPQNLFHNANPATMGNANQRTQLSGLQRGNHQTLLSKINNPNQKVQRYQPGNRQVVQQSQIVKSQKSAYQRAPDQETKSSKSVLSKRQNNSVIPKRRDSKQGRISNIPVSSFESVQQQNATNVLQYHKAAQVQRDPSTKKESQGSNRHLMDGLKSNSRTLLPMQGGILEQVAGPHGSSFGGKARHVYQTGDLTKSLPKNQRANASFYNSAYNTTNLNQLNQQINQMVNSETFKKIFKDLEEKSKEMNLDGRKMQDVQGLVDLDAVCNQVSNTASASFAHERTDLSGCQSMNSEKSLRTQDQAELPTEGVNSLDYTHASTNSRGGPFKKSASNFIQENRMKHSQMPSSLNISLDTMCALTGLTNSQLKILLETDYQAEKKIADRIIAKTQLAGGKFGKERHEPNRPAKATREQALLTRNIDILNLAAGMVTNKDAQRDLMADAEEYSHGLTRSKGSQLHRAQQSQSKQQRQRNSELGNSQASLLGSQGTREEGRANEAKNMSAKDEQVPGQPTAVDDSFEDSRGFANDEVVQGVRRSFQKSQIVKDIAPKMEESSNTKAFAIKHTNQQPISLSGQQFFPGKDISREISQTDETQQVTNSVTPALLLENERSMMPKVDYASPQPEKQRRHVVDQQIQSVKPAPRQRHLMQYSPSNRQLSTLKGPLNNHTPLQSALPNQASSGQHRQAALASAGGRSSIILSNRQILLDKMSRQFPAGAAADTGFGGQYNAAFHIGGKQINPMTFCKEYADEVPTNSQGKLLGAQNQIVRGAFGPFPVGYVQQGRPQLAVASDGSIWARQAHSGDKVTSPYSRSNRGKVMGLSGERTYSKEKIPMARNMNVYDGQGFNRTPVKQPNQQLLSQPGMPGSGAKSQGRGIKCTFVSSSMHNSINPGAAGQSNKSQQPSTLGKQQAQTVGGRPAREAQGTTQKQPAPSTQPEKAPDEFDIEYAKLIARQFPIHDEHGNVIDYSNINEFQLELLALHEEYGEETDFEARRRIFEKLSSMNEEEFYKNRAKANKGASQNSSSTSASTAHDSLGKKAFSRRPYGMNVGKDGGNPDYKKTVIQLERERIEREKQELIMKRKRNSNYIQQCIRHGNEHYDQQRLNSLAWLRKETKRDDDGDGDTKISSHLDDKNQEILRRKQEIIKKYNKMSKENGQVQPDDGIYRYSLIKGNNSALVKRVLDTRDHLMELDQPHLTLYSFKWAPVSRFINYEQLGLHGQKKVVNHLECHGLLTTKDQLYINMHRYCEQNKLNVFQYLPIQFVLDISSKNFISEVDRFCQYFNTIEKVRIKSQNGGAKGSSGQPEPGQLDFDQQLVKINQLITQNKNIQAELKYKNIVSRKFTMFNELYKGRNVWLIKPNDFNRGRGVRLFNTLEQLRKLMKEFSLGNEMDFYMHNACCQILANERQLGNIQTLQARLEDSEKTNEPQSPKQNGGIKLQEQVNGPGSNMDSGTASSAQLAGAAPSGPNFSVNVKSEVFVIQKYIERPLLIDARKFDIRLWVLINCCDLQNQRCYLFSEGYIRTSSYPFSLSQESIDQPFVHLTNNAVQQHDQNYGKLEEGNQLSFNQARELLQQQKGLDVDFHKIYNDEILKIILMSLKSVDNGRLNPNFKKHTFEILGYDFMIDEDMRPWLIEVNTNPCLEETSALLRQLLPRMLDDAFKLTLDVWLPPKQNQTNERAPAAASEAQTASTGVTGSGMEATTSTQSSRSPGKGKQHFKVDGYDDSENLWRHIYTLKNH